MLKWQTEIRWCGSKNRGAERHLSWSAEWHSCKLINKHKLSEDEAQTLKGVEVRELKEVLMSVEVIKGARNISWRLKTESRCQLEGRHHINTI